MFRSKVKSLILAVIVGGVLAVGVSESQAGWHHWAYWGGYPAYYAPYGGWYGAAVWPGPYRYWGCGYGCRHHGCGWGGCWDSCCYNTSCYNTSCYSSCWDTCGCGTVVSPAVPAMPGSPAPTLAPPSEAAPAPPGTAPAAPSGPQTRSEASDDAGLLTIMVPEEATVFINGYQTKSTGTTRQYVSRGLKPGLSYKYEVRAEMVRDGRTVENTQVVYLSAGNTQRLAFSFNGNPQERLAASW